MGSSGALDSDLWDTLLLEINRLSTGHRRGVNFSEDFAVDQVCSAFAKLLRSGRRESHAGGGGGCCLHEEDLDELPRFGNREDPATARSELDIRGENIQIVQMRSEIAIEEENLLELEARLEDARAEVARAHEARAALKAELEAEEAWRRQESEGQAQLWKEVAARTHQCLASLRAKEQEAAQLQPALHRLGDPHGAWDVLTRNLQLELDAARSEELEARTELELLLSAGRARAGCELSSPEARHGAAGEGTPRTLLQQLRNGALVQGSDDPRTHGEGPPRAEPGGIAGIDLDRMQRKILDDGGTDDQRAYCVRPPCAEPQHASIDVDRVRRKILEAFGSLGDGHR